MNQAAPSAIKSPGGSGSARGEELRDLSAFLDDRANGHAASTLTGHWTGQQPVGQAKSDIVHHNCVDDLVTTGLRFEKARDKSPKGATCHSCQQSQRHVDEARQTFDRITHKGRTSCANEKLPFNADVEQTRPEAKRDCQTGEDIGRRDDQAFQNWVDRYSDLVGCSTLEGSDDLAKIPPKSAGKQSPVRNVNLVEGCADSSEETLRECFVNAGGTGQNDQDRPPDQQAGQDREGGNADG